MVYSIEELLKIDVYDPTVARPNILLSLVYCLMGTATWAKAITAF
jgi:hypothetical protein